MEVRAEIGGREVSLKYTVNSMCAIEDRAGSSLDQLMERQYSAVRLLVWGGMIAERPETSLTEVGEWIGRHLQMGGTLEEIAAVCAGALERSGFLGDETA